MSYDFDVCIIGSGPGGYVSAIRVAQLGLKVAIVEKESVLGGTCLNYGCIPTKALLHCAGVYKKLKTASTFGITCDNISFDVEKMINYSRNVVKELNHGVEYLMKKNNISVIKGFASFVDKNTISVKDNKDVAKVVKAKYFVIATGASCRSLPNIEFDENLICSYKGAMLPKKMPKSVVIIGGGVIGIEFASFYSTFDCDVRILEIADNILKTEDTEIVDALKKSFAKSNIQIDCGIKNLEIDKNNNSVKINYTLLDKKITVNADKVIVAIGIVPNTKDLNLTNAGVIVNEKGYVLIDDFCKTNINNIFAIGDIVNGPWLAHKASHEGIIVAEKIAFLEKRIQHEPHKLQVENIAGCIYSYPQIASIGLTEAKALELKKDFKVGRFNDTGNGKSIATNARENFVKIITDKKTDEILGVHLIGENVTELIHSFSIAKQSELVKNDIINAIFPHPTISEMLQEATLDVDKIALHK